MNFRSNACAAAALLGLAFGWTADGARGQDPRRIPPPLDEWRGWAAWEDRDAESPRSWRDARKRFGFWPAALRLEADQDGALAELEVSVFLDGWQRLPGGPNLWPVSVLVNGEARPVVPRGGGHPAVRLEAGRHRVSCRYAWSRLPQRMALPPDLGILSLVLEGQPVPRPSWDAGGGLWFRRDDLSAETDRDSLSVALYAVLEDGIPLRWHGKLELTVSGKSREEVLGPVLPGGWLPASVSAPIPAAMDGEGRLKVQVRPGKWTVNFLAFRRSPPGEIRFGDGFEPAVPEMLVGFRALPGFRLAEIEGLAPVDPSQTSFPAEWRDLPVYRWETGLGFRLTERLRGMGESAPAGLRIERSLWLDDDGRGFTFQDMLTGAIRETWRLDAAPEQDLGSVREDGEGLLITRNPETGAPGVELRTGQVRLEAVGRMERGRDLPSSGWLIPVESVRTTLHLPPGYRLFSLHGADWTRGDWLTAWSLLDLFLLLIFTIAVTRLWGFRAGAAAFLAFGLSYHEPGAPRYSWLFLLMPLALLRVDGQAPWFRRAATLWKWGMILILVLRVTPFAARQIQQAIYPQLERVAPAPGARRAAGRIALSGAAGEWYEAASLDSVKGAPSRAARARAFNLMQDAQARIQTGPGIPDWTWRTAGFGLSGPVTPPQRVRILLVPPAAERTASVARVLLSVGLLFHLLRNRKTGSARPRSRAGLAAGLAAMALFAPAAARAQFPDPALLETLRGRLAEAPDAFPHAADLPAVDLALEGNRIVMTVEIHAAARCAVPLPGRLPAWSPVRVTGGGDGGEPVLLRREEGFLWAMVEEGIHRVRVEGLLPEVAEWELAFLLRPRRISVTAPDWSVSGVDPDGVPGAQVLFVRRERGERAESSYEHQEFSPMVSVRRELELGLVWRVRTTVRRLSPPGRAISLRIPLLPGENVLSTAMVRDGFLDVLLGADQSATEWESELPLSGELLLCTRPDDAWVEEWRLSVSPVWNVAATGLTPSFDARPDDLRPFWTPWPGESVGLRVTRPEAVAGATVTMHSLANEVRLGPRQRSARLTFSAQASLGEDFRLELPEEAEIAELTLDGQAIPVRREGGSLAIPLRPARQTVSLDYRISEPMGFRTRLPALRLPVESANVSLSLRLPEDRWLLWARGPMRGPAVRFWAVLGVALAAALVLRRLPGSPLSGPEWMLLAVGLTQVPLPAALVVPGWIFLLAWRGRPGNAPGRRLPFILLQAALAALTLAALGVLVATVSAGLLGSPSMFVMGGGSTRLLLQWYQAHSGPEIPRPEAFAVSVWWYRLLMLLWALWLAFALVRWLRWGWAQFSRGGCFGKPDPRPARPAGPPPLPGGRSPGAPRESGPDAGLRACGPGG